MASELTLPPRNFRHSYGPEDDDYDRAMSSYIMCVCAHTRTLGWFAKKTI